MWILVLLLNTSVAFAATAPALSAAIKAGGAKTGNYLANGIISGGSSRVQQASLNDIRLGAGSGKFERLVFDLSEIPYFQIKKEGSILVSFLADVQQTQKLSAKKLKTAISKSKLISRIEAIPRVEPKMAMYEIKLSRATKPVRVEAFELQNPPRVILDITDQ